MDGLGADVVDRAVRDRAARWLAGAGIRLPTLSELAHPDGIRAAQAAALGSADPDRPDPANLYRLHWYNDRSRRRLAETPAYLVLPPELT